MQDPLFKEYEKSYISDPVYPFIQLDRIEVFQLFNRDFQCQLNEPLVIQGTNASGKSNIHRALSLCFTPSKSGNTRCIRHGFDTGTVVLFFKVSGQDKTLKRTVTHGRSDMIEMTATDAIWKQMCLLWKHQCLLLKPGKAIIRDLVSLSCVQGLKDMYREMGKDITRYDAMIKNNERIIHHHKILTDSMDRGGMEKELAECTMLLKNEEKRMKKLSRNTWQLPKSTKVTRSAFVSKFKERDMGIFEPDYALYLFKEFDCVPNQNNMAMVNEALDKCKNDIKDMRKRKAELEVSIQSLDSSIVASTVNELHQQCISLSEKANQLRIYRKNWDNIVKHYLESTTETLVKEANEMLEKWKVNIVLTLENNVPMMNGVHFDFCSHLESVLGLMVLQLTVMSKTHSMQYIVIDEQLDAISVKNEKILKYIVQSIKDYTNGSLIITHHFLETLTPHMTCVQIE